MPSVKTPPKRNTRGVCSFWPDEIAEILRYREKTKSYDKTIAKFSYPPKLLSKSTIVGWEARLIKTGVNRDNRCENRGKPKLCPEMQQFIHNMYRAHRKQAHAITTPILLLLAVICVDIGYQSGTHVNCCCESKKITLGVMYYMRKKWRIVYRCPTTSRPPVSAAQAAAAQENLALDVGSYMIEHDILDPDMIINCDELGQKHLSARAKTLETKGMRTVAVAALSDKRAVTIVVGGSASGNLLDPQVVYQGTTNRCHPLYEFPPGWLISHTQNHWATAATMCEYIEKILVPYFNSIREKKPELTCPGMCIMDGFGGHVTEAVYDKFSECNIIPVVLPPNMTHLLQPMDLTVCGTWKSAVRSEQENYFVQQLRKSLQTAANVEQMTVEQLAEYVGEPPTGFVELKRATAGWFVQAHETVKKMRRTITAGFDQAGLSAVIKPLCNVVNSAF